MIDIDDPKQGGRFALFNLGFRPFFLGAAGYAVVSVAVWMVIYLTDWSVQPYGLPASMWHAHEMIFGYAMAVIAGFLLTAVRNWTNIPTLNGTPLLLLCLLWLVGRIVPFLSDVLLIGVVALADCLFTLLLIFALSVPIVKARTWNNLAIISVLALMLLAQLSFYLGVAGVVEGGVYYGLYSGLYLIVALIFIMGRRVIPFFIEKGVGYAVQLTNRRWLDVASLVLFLCFWVSDLLWPNAPVAAALAALLFVLHALRLAGWHTSGIWGKPLLWVLYLAYAWMVLAFALKAAVYIFDFSASLALHAFAYGGIGMMTMGMMARVSLGHTGRNIAAPPPWLAWAFALLFIGALVRVILPLLDPSHYAWWIGLSQGLWLAAFALFFVIYLPILTRPRIDGRVG
ncbi:NnrS family protein [Candidatus Tenderia electrophaga]|jgi:uncharacterized protein involved in response to NO|uniref:NnrS family protein n=1 Tax=Candidatus Tenderia electrophaga TaxID=1748243 RepID=A0A0S2TGW9_9GAMM|nr:NnrS family protein [Candidatus Tenderia electrophaga]